MTPEVFMLCVFAALLELDTTYAFQLTFSRGIIAAPLMSLITGDVMAGIQIGVFTELILRTSARWAVFFRRARWCVRPCRLRLTLWG